MIFRPKTDAVLRLEAAQDQARNHKRLVNEALEAIRLSKPYKGNAPECVCLKPYQFSCWNGKSLKDLEHLLKVKQGRYAILLAKTVKQLSRSYVGYANHYHATWMKKKPYWAKDKKPVKEIGQHAFYKL